MRQEVRLPEPGGRTAVKQQQAAIFDLDRTIDRLVTSRIWGDKATDEERERMLTMLAKRAELIARDQS